MHMSSRKKSPYLQTLCIFFTWLGLWKSVIWDSGADDELLDLSDSSVSGATQSDPGVSGATQSDPGVSGTTESDPIVPATT